MWQEAVAHFGRVCLVDPENEHSPLLPNTSFETVARFAQLLVVAGKREKHLHLCEQLLQRYEANPNQLDGLWLAFASSQSLGTKIRPTLLIELFEKQAEIWPNERWLQTYIRNG